MTNDEPNLGLATTSELLDELVARLETIDVGLALSRAARPGEPTDPIGSVTWAELDGRSEVGLSAALVLLCRLGHATLPLALLNYRTADRWIDE